MTTPLAAALADLRSELERSYRNTIYCASLIEQGADGKLRTRYCGNRWCLVCNRVRTARAINRYEPRLAEWSDRQFVTLTLPNVRGDALRDTLRGMRECVVLCWKSIRRRRPGVRALRKLECTHNVVRDDYHPHYHLVVEGADVAHALVDAWLERNPNAVRAAQDVRPCDDGALREVFKYFTKLTVKAGTREDGKRAIIRPVHLDAIFRALKGSRVYQPMGFAAPVPKGEGEDDDVRGDATAATSRLGEDVLWEWLQSLHDWVDLSTGECLTGYEPGERLRRFVDGVGGGA